MATTEKVAVLPTMTVCAVGCVLMLTGEITVNVATELVVLPSQLVATRV